jgi:hypothetical protein
MSTAFELATLDLMSNPDFAETATFREQSVSCVASEVAEAPTLSEFGEDEGVSFFLRIEARLLSAPPKKYERITFRGTTYKISRADLDSAGLVWRIYLVSLSSRGN